MINHSSPIEFSKVDVSDHKKAHEEFIDRTHRIRYDLIRQKLVLETLDKLGYFGTDQEKPYDFVVEEAPCMALSMARLLRNKERIATAWNAERFGVQFWHLLSEDYDYDNPFHIKGYHGKFLIQNGQTKAYGINYTPAADPRRLAITLENEQVKLTSLPPRHRTLLVVQGCPLEHAFSLATTEYDIAFADTHSELDKTMEYAYEHLFRYLQDVCGYRKFRQPEIHHFVRFDGNGLVTNVVSSTQNPQLTLKSFKAGAFERH